jgi:hypothetical protein
MKMNSDQGWSLQPLPERFGKGTPNKIEQEIAHKFAMILSLHHRICVKIFKWWRFFAENATAHVRRKYFGIIR